MSNSSPSPSAPAAAQTAFNNVVPANSDALKSIRIGGFRFPTNGREILATKRKP